MANNLSSKAEKIFRKNFARFCNVLKNEDDLLPHLVAEKIITYDDLDEIKSKNPAEKGPTMLRHISGPLEAGHTHGFYVLLDVMINHGKLDTQEFARKIKHECLSSSNVPQVQSTVVAPFTSANTSSSASMHQGINPTVTSSIKVPKNELLYTLNDLTHLVKSKINKIENDVMDKDQDKHMINGVQLLLMVVNPSEYYAAMFYFSKNEARILNNYGTIYYIGKWGEIPAALVKQQDSGFNGIGRSNQLTRSSVNLFCNLKLIVALGVCGITVQTEGLANVVVSTKICGCNHLKFTDEIINRSEITEAGDRILRCLKHNSEFWSFTCTKPEYNQYKSKAKFKPMLSGTPLIASGEFRDKLIRGVNKEALGVEMEGIGVLQALREVKKRDSIEFVIVKAGCDYADEEKNKEWQPVAAMAAADFLYEQLTKKIIYEEFIESQWCRLLKAGLLAPCRCN